MKKILITTNVLFLCLVIFQAWSKNQDQCAVIICKDYSSVPLSGTISPETARILSVNYKGDKGKKYIWNGSTPTTTEDAASVWFQLEKLKRFIWEIEHSNCVSNCKDSLGIRIYYARYPDTSRIKVNPELRTLNPKFANHHTVFMVPTYFDKRLDKNIDLDITKGCRIPFTLGSLSKQAHPGVFIAMSTMSPPAPSNEFQNHGGVAPPPPGAGVGVFPTY